MCSHQGLHVTSLALPDPSPGVPKPLPNGLVAPRPLRASRLGSPQSSAVKGRSASKARVAECFSKRGCHHRRCILQQLIQRLQACSRTNNIVILHVVRVCLVYDVYDGACF